MFARFAFSLLLAQLLYYNLSTAHPHPPDLTRGFSNDETHGPVVSRYYPEAFKEEPNSELTSRVEPPSNGILSVKGTLGWSGTAYTGWPWKWKRSVEEEERRGGLMEFVEEEGVEVPIRRFATIVSDPLPTKTMNRQIRAKRVAPMPGVEKLPWILQTGTIPNSFPTGGFEEPSIAAKPQPRQAPQELRINVVIPSSLVSGGGGSSVVDSFGSSRVATPTSTSLAIAAVNDPVASNTKAPVWAPDVLKKVSVLIPLTLGICLSLALLIFLALKRCKLSQDSKDDSEIMETGQAQQPNVSEPRDSTSPAESRHESGRRHGRSRHEHGNSKRHHDRDHGHHHRSRYPPSHSNFRGDGYESHERGHGNHHEWNDFPETPNARIWHGHRHGHGHDESDRTASTDSGTTQALSENSSNSQREYRNGNEELLEQPIGEPNLHPEYGHSGTVTEPDLTPFYRGGWFKTLFGPIFHGNRNSTSRQFDSPTSSPPPASAPPMSNPPPTDPRTETLPRVRRTWNTTYVLREAANRLSILSGGSPLSSGSSGTPSNEVPSLRSRPTMLQDVTRSASGNEVMDPKSSRRGTMRNRRKDLRDNWLNNLFVHQAPGTDLGSITNHPERPSRKPIGSMKALHHSPERLQSEAAYGDKSVAQVNGLVSRLSSKLTRNLQRVGIPDQNATPTTIPGPLDISRPSIWARYGARSAPPESLRDTVDPSNATPVKSIRKEDIHGPITPIQGSSGYNSGINGSISPTPRVGASQERNPVIMSRIPPMDQSARGSIILHEPITTGLATDSSSPNSSHRSSLQIDVASSANNTTVDAFSALGQPCPDSMHGTFSQKSSPLVDRPNIEHLPLSVSQTPPKRRVYLEESLGSNDAHSDSPSSTHDLDSDPATEMTVLIPDSIGSISNTDHSASSSDGSKHAAGAHHHDPHGKHSAYPDLDDNFSDVELADGYCLKVVKTLRDREIPYTDSVGFSDDSSGSTWTTENDALENNIYRSKIGSWDLKTEKKLVRENESEKSRGDTIQKAVEVALRARERNIREREKRAGHYEH